MHAKISVVSRFPEGGYNTFYTDNDRTPKGRYEEK